MAVTFGISKRNPDTIETIEEDGISAARSCGYGHEKVSDNADNIYATKLDKTHRRDEAAQKLDEIFTRVREDTQLIEFREKVQGKPVVSGKSANMGMAAAAVMFAHDDAQDKDGYAVKSAGDALVFAVGENGNILILNEEAFRRAKALSDLLAATGMNMSMLGQSVSSSITPGNPAIDPEDHSIDLPQYREAVIDYNGFITIEEIEAVVGKNFKILGGSDGLTGQLATVEEMKKHLEGIAADIPFDSPQYAQHFLEKAKAHEVMAGKPDDIVVVECSGNCIVMAADGIADNPVSVATSHKAAYLAHEVIGEEQALDDLHVAEGNTPEPTALYIVASLLASTLTPTIAYIHQTVGAQERDYKGYVKTDELQLRFEGENKIVLSDHRYGDMLEVTISDDTPPQFTFTSLSPEGNISELNCIEIYGSPLYALEALG